MAKGTIGISVTVSRTNESKKEPSGTQQQPNREVDRAKVIPITKHEEA